MEHVSHLPRSSGRFSGYSLDAQQLPGARVNNQLRTSLRPDGARHFNAQDPTSGVDPELLHDETRFVVDFWQGKVAGPGYAARKSFRQSLGQQQPLPIPPPIEETMRAVLKHNNLVLDKVDQEKFDLFDVWLNKQAYLRTFRPSEILLVICGILEMEKTYDILNSNYEISELKKIHASLSEGGIFKPLSEESYLGDYQLMKPNPEYSFSSLFGTPKAGVDRFITSLENRVVLEDHLRAAMVSHLISTYENAGRLVLDKNDVRLKKHPKLPRKDKRPQITRDERFYLEFLDLDFTSYDGYTAAFCAAATCRHQNSEPTEIKKDVVKYLELNKTLSELAMHNVSFIQPSDGKLDNRKRLFITSLFTIIFGFAALFFWLITTYSATHFSVNYKCEAVFGGLVLQPYGVILANIIFFKLFERTINSTIDFFSYLYYKYHNDEDKLILKMSVEEEGGIRAMEDGKMRQDAGGLWASLRQKTPTSPAKATAKDEETETKNLYVMHQYLIAWKQDSHYRESDFFIQTPFIFFYLQLLYGFVSIIMACYNVSKLQLSDWDRYTTLFGIILNSCVPMTFFQALKLRWLDGREIQMEILDRDYPYTSA